MIITDVPDNEIRVFHLSRTERFGVSSSSNGNQIKWKHGNIFIKQNLLGYEDVAEVLVSHFLSFTDLKECEYVKYYSCIIYEDEKLIGNGCYSYDYIKDYTEVSVSSILDSHMLSHGVSYDELRWFLLDIVGFDVKNYLDKILSIDSITRNDDRHFKNISFLYKDGKYICSPIFDNGSSCLSDTVSYPMNIPIEDNFKSVYAKPFKSIFKYNFVDNKPLVIDYNGFIKSVIVENEFSKRAFKTILLGLKDMEGISWVRR